MRAAAARPSVTTHRTRWRLRLACLAAVSIVLSACALGGPTRDSLNEENEAGLRTDGSVELISNGGHDAEQTPEGRLAAIAWREYGVNSSWDAVVAYFEVEMRGRGWEPGGGSSGRSTQEHAVVAWHKGDRILRLSYRRNAIKPGQGSFSTFYRVTLIGQGVPSQSGRAE